MKVHLIDQRGTTFAVFEMEALPRKDDIIEVGFPGEQHVKSFSVHRIVHKMIQLRAYETKYVEGVAVQCRNDPPWRWEFQAHGSLFDPTKTIFP